MNEDKCIPLSVAKSYLDVYNSTETLFEAGYIGDDEYNRIIRALCCTMVGRMALVLQHRSEKEKEAEV